MTEKNNQAAEIVEKDLVAAASDTESVNDFESAEGRMLITEQEDAKGESAPTSTAADGRDEKTPIIFLDDVHVIFKTRTGSILHPNKVHAVNGLTLKLMPGETIGIVGGTGSSKSSLVNLISRLYDVNEGAVYVGGKDVRSYDLDTLRNEVSVVLQQNVLFSGSILDNLRWGDPNATEEQCIEACKQACADEFIQTFPDKYNTHIEQGGTNVSGGQKQRLCIARALLKKPKVLILDDSTSAVDTATDARIRKAFREAIPGTTKIIIAQRISSVMSG